MNLQKDPQQILMVNSTSLNIYKIQDKPTKHASSIHANSERQSIISKQTSQESIINYSQKPFVPNNQNQQLLQSDEKQYPECIQSNNNQTTQQNNSINKTQIQCQSVSQNTFLQNDSSKKGLRSMIGLSYQASEGYENLCEKATAKSKIDQLKFNSDMSQKLLKDVKSDIEKQTKLEFQQNLQKNFQNTGINSSNNYTIIPKKQRYTSSGQFSQTGIRNLNLGAQGRGNNVIHRLNKSDVGQILSSVIENKSQLQQQQDLSNRERKLDRNLKRNNSNILKQNDGQTYAPSEPSFNSNSYLGYVQNNSENKNKRIRRQSNHDGLSNQDLANNNKVQLNQTYNNTINGNKQDQGLQPYNKNKISAFISKENSTIINQSLVLINSFRKNTYNLGEKKSYHCDDKTIQNNNDRKIQNLQDNKVNLSQQEKPADIKSKQIGRFSSMGSAFQHSNSQDQSEKNKQNLFEYSNSFATPRIQSSNQQKSYNQHVERRKTEIKQKQHSSVNPEQQILVKQFLKDKSVDSKDWPKLREKIYFTLQMKSFNNNQLNIENNISSDRQQSYKIDNFLQKEDISQSKRKLQNEGEKKISSFRGQHEESQIQQFQQNLFNSIFENKEINTNQHQIKEAALEHENQEENSQIEEDEEEQYINDSPQNKDFVDNSNNNESIKENTFDYHSPQNSNKNQVIKLDLDQVSQDEQQSNDITCQVKQGEFLIRSERNFSSSDLNEKQTGRQSSIKSARYSSNKDRNKSPVNSSYFKGSTVITDNFKDSVKKNNNYDSFTPNQSKLKKLDSLQTPSRMSTPNSRQIPFKDKVNSHNEMNFMKYSIISDLENQATPSTFRNQQLQADKTQNSIFTNATNKTNTFKHEIMNSLCLIQLKKIKQKVTQEEKERFKAFFNEIINTQNLLKYQKDTPIDQIAPEYKLHQIKYIPRGNQDIFENKSLRQIYKERYLKDKQSMNNNQLSTLQKAVKDRQEQKKSEDAQETRREYKDDKNVVYSKEQNLKKDINELVSEQIQRREEDEKYLQRISIKEAVSPRIKKHLDFTQQLASKWSSFRYALFQFIEKIQRLSLSMDKIIEEKLFSRVPFGRPCSQEFFECVKNGKYQQVIQFLHIDKYLVYCYDNLYCLICLNSQLQGLNTPLQWACKRGHTKIAQKLIEYNSDLDHKNQVNKTALYYACSSNDITTAVLLLKKRANPWSQGKCSLNQFIDNLQGDKSLFQAAKRVHFMMNLVSMKKKNKIWEDFQYLFYKTGK